MITRTEPQLKVFISYSRQDREAADALVNDLQREGFEVTIDRRDLTYGEEWQEELREFIQESDTVIWLVSPDSVGSRWVKWELGEVQRNAKRLLPIVVTATPPEGLPESLGKLHLLPATGTYSDDQHLQDLVETLQTDRGWTKDHTRLGAAARRWIAQGRASDLLLRGQPLKEAEDWRTARPTAAAAPDSIILELISASQERARRRQTQWIIGLAVVGACLFGLAAFSLVQEGVANDARNVAEERLIEAQKSESNALATVAQQQIAQKEYGNAVALAARGLPDDPGSPGARPVTVAPLQVLYDTFHSLREFRVLRVHEEQSQDTSGPTRGGDPSEGGSNTGLPRSEKSEPAGQRRQLAGARELQDGRILLWFNDDETDGTALIWNPGLSEPETFVGDKEELRGQSIVTNGARYNRRKRMIKLEDGRLLIWDVQTRHRRRRYWGSSPDDFTARIFKPDAPEAAESLPGHDTPIAGALQLRDGRIITWSSPIFEGYPKDELRGIPSSERVTRPADNLVRIWAPDGSPDGTLAGHEGAVIGALQMKTGHILTLGEDNTARLWNPDAVESPLDLGAGVEDKVFALSLRDGRVLSWTWKAERVASEFSRRGDRLTWNAGPAQLWNTDGRKGPVFGTAVNGALELSDGRILMWGDDGTHIWTGRGSKDAELDTSFLGALGLQEGRLLTWDGSTGQFWNADLSAGPTVEYPGDIVGALEMQDGRLVTWSGIGTIRPITADPALPDEMIARIWKADGAPGPVLSGHEDVVTGAIQLRDGRIVTWSDDATVRIWSPSDGAQELILRQKYAVLGVLQLDHSRILVWTVDRTPIATISNRAKPAQIWRLNGEPGPFLLGESAEVTGALALGGGRFLTWNKEKTTVQLWNNDGTAGPVLNHPEPVQGVSQLKDGRIFTWGAGKSKARIWPENAEEMISWSKSVVNRIGDLSAKERCKFNLAPDHSCLAHLSTNP